MTTQSEALRLADEWWRKTQSEADRRNSAYDHYGMDNTPENVDPLGAKMAAELRRLHAENERLASAADKIRRFWRNEAHRLLAQREALLEALKYHQEQTRPIQRTIDVIKAVEETK